VAKHFVNEVSFFFFWVTRHLVSFELLAVFLCQLFPSLFFLRLLLSLEFVHTFQVVSHARAIVIVTSS
jgi:hypothetical protein